MSTSNIKGAEPTSTPLLLCATEVFSLPGGRLFSFILLRHCFWWIAAVVFLGLALICVGFAVDLRLVVAGLMVWCFFMPLLVAFCRLHYMLSPLNAFNLLPHHLVFEPNGIRVIVQLKTDKEDKGDEEFEEAQPPEPILREFFYPLKNVCGAENYTGGTFLAINSGKGKVREYLFVPASDNETIMANLQTIISQL